MQLESSHGAPGREEEAESNCVAQPSALDNHEEHVFILSSAGKPVYARHYQGERLAEYMGIVQAMVSVFEDDDQDMLQCIHSHGLAIYFLQKGPIYLVATTRNPLRTSEAMMLSRLNLIYACIVSITTQRNIDRIFGQRKNYDLRQLLDGAEPIIDRLCDAAVTDPGLLLCQRHDRDSEFTADNAHHASIQCLCISAMLRSGISGAMSQAVGKNKDVVFGLLIANDQALVQLVRHRNHRLNPLDYHLITNMLQASNSFRTAGETWLPLCLPALDDSCFCHVYVHYPESDETEPFVSGTKRSMQDGGSRHVDDKKRLCFVLVSKSTQAFFSMSSIQQSMQKALKSSGCWEELNKTLARGDYPCDETDIPFLIHFIYKHHQYNQYTSPSLPPCYANDRAERERLYGLYSQVYMTSHPTMDTSSFLDGGSGYAVESHRTFARALSGSLGSLSLISGTSDSAETCPHIDKSPVNTNMVQNNAGVRMYFATFETESMLVWISKHFDMYLVLDPFSSKKQAIHAANQLQRWIRQHESRLFIPKSPLVG